MDREQRGPVTLTDVLSLANLVEKNRNGAEMHEPEEISAESIARLHLSMRDCHTVIDESARKSRR
jgi:hypothetical protein